MESSPSLDIAYQLPDSSRNSIQDDSPRFQRAAEWVYGAFDLTELSASISIVDDSTIHRLNREHLQHDWPTDVISFSFEPPPRVHGEIIASADTALRLSEQAGWTGNDELLLYIVHGLLHLAGLDDLDDDQRKEMRIQEQACLVSLGVPGAKRHLERFDDVSY